MSLRITLAAALLASACNGSTKVDTAAVETGTGYTTPPTDTHSTLGDEPWCAVQEMFRAECLVCHGATGTLGDLDLETDPYAALVGVASMYPGWTLVEPGDPSASFLLTKLNDAQAGDEGTMMPPTGAIAAADIAVVETWIAEGASDVCGGVDTGITSGGYHADGFSSSAVHGLAAKLQDETCVNCHGEDLMGGSAGVSCDTCHEPDWRTNCTYCHGGDETLDGAPPRDIDGSTDPSMISFSAHTDHVTTDIHGAYDCTQCHVTPTDVLSLGHVFLGDATPAVSEVEFGDGLSSAGSYASGTCSNLYCHGNGQNTASVTVETGSDACDACHGSQANASSWFDLSGEHREHLGEGVQCGDCHATTVAGNSTIIDPDLHVNGELDLELPAGITYNGSTCTGSCHGESHNNRGW